MNTDLLRRLTLLATLLATSAALAAEGDLPTPEQIDQVTKTQPMQAIEEAAKPVDDEGPLVLDEVSVTASRVHEIAYRTVELGLQRIRSDKAEEADYIVCQRMQRVGSHITKVYCATNRTWNYIRKQTTRDFLGAPNTLGAPYPLYEGPVYELSPSALNTIGKRFAANGEEHSARLAQLTAEETVARMSDEWATSATVVARFARAFDDVGRIAKLGGEPKAVEDKMGAAIAAQGFSVEQYNDLVARLESSERFKKRVSAATQAMR